MGIGVDDVRAGLVLRVKGICIGEQAGCYCPSSSPRESPLQPVVWPEYVMHS